jgi:hypothetical protein
MNTNSIERLQKVCAEFLDNADLQVSLDSAQFAIRLTFYVAGSDKKFEVECRDVRELSMLKHAVERPFFTVMKTKVVPPRQPLPEQWNDFELKVNDVSAYLWAVEVEGTVSLRIKSLRLSWLEGRLSDEERAYFTTA